MKIDESKIFFLQSHEWGGQIMAVTGNNNKIFGKHNRFHSNSNLFVLEKTQYQCDYNDTFFSFMPVAQNQNNGLFYLVNCSAVYASAENLPTLPPFPIAPPPYSSYIDMQDFFIKQQLYYEIKDQQSAFGKKNEATFKTNSIVLWNNETKAFFTAPYVDGNSYSTKFKIITIPSYSPIGTSNLDSKYTVFALKFYIESDPSFEKYFAIRTPETMDPSEINLIPTDSIINRSQLWYLRNIRGL